MKIKNAKIFIIQLNAIHQFTQYDTLYSIYHVDSLLHNKNKTILYENIPTISQIENYFIEFTLPDGFDPFISNVAENLRSILFAEFDTDSNILNLINIITDSYFDFTKILQDKEADLFVEFADYLTLDSQDLNNFFKEKDRVEVYNIIRKLTSYFFKNIQISA